ncbi:hypothetical protein BVY04_04365 [bacterium M21]|nr:hypothetical protein BVY04_04225 [bacterium M21]OVE81049.1 hypothetical protein BVY04_04365 [bacterium M21]
MAIVVYIVLVIIAVMLLAWVPLLAAGIYHLKKNGKKTGSIVMVVLGGLWGAISISIFIGGLFIYNQIRSSYKETVFDASSYEGATGKLIVPVSSKAKVRVGPKAGGFLSSEASGGSITLPEGTFTLYSLEITEKDSKGKKWTLSMSPTGNKSSITIKADKDASFDAGPPVKTWLESSVSGQNKFHLSLKSVDRYGNKVVLNSNRSDESRFQILSLDEKVLMEGNFEYG